MDRSIPLLLIGLVFGSGIGFLVAASTGATLDGHDHETGHETGHDTANATQDAEHDHSQHDHSELVDVTGPAPTLDIEMIPDSMAGWNLHLKVSNFRFSGEHAGQDSVEGEGHAHLHVNGTKITRVYGDWYYIESLPEGTSTIEVGLYTNDHKGFSVDGQQIKQTVTVTSP